MQSGFINVVELGSLHQCPGFQKVVGGNAQFSRHVVNVDRLGGGNPVSELSAKFAESDELQPTGVFGKRIENVEILEVFFNEPEEA